MSEVLRTKKEAGGVMVISYPYIVVFFVGTKKRDGISWYKWGEGGGGEKVTDRRVLMSLCM